MLKKIFIVITMVPLLAHGQWLQQGNDIDGENAGDQTGYATCLSADGSIVAIGGRLNDFNGGASGHVRVFENQSGIWVQKGNNMNGDEVNDKFGSSVSLSADGNTLAAGAPDNNGNGFESGHVKVFRFESNDWMQIGDDIIGEVFSDHSGFSISLSDDGNRLAIGAPDNGLIENVGSNFGHVRVYENQSDVWVQIGDDIDGENVEDKSGFSVSLNEDGSIVAVGAPLNDGTGSSAGHVRVYINESGDWVQIGDDIEGGADNYKSGSSVSLNNQGNILAIGAIDNNNSGSARIYENQSNTWVQIGNDIEGEETNDDFGISISTNAGGNMIAVGGYFNDGTMLNSGHVRVYENENNNWIQFGDDIDGEAIEDRSGISVSLSADGGTVAIGAHLNDGNGTSAGHVRVYANSNVLSIYDRELEDSFSVYPNPSAGHFIIKAETQKRVVGYTVIDMTGRISAPLDGHVIKQTDTLSNLLEINIDVPTGIYLLRLELEEGSVESYRIGVVR